MAAKRSWRRISPRVGGLTIVVWSVVALLGLLYRAELRWAADALPGYLATGIPLPAETGFYRDARKLIDGDEWQQQQAEELLERSLAIDPNGEAGFWLAELARERGLDDLAVQQYEAYLRIDPTRHETYLQLSGIHERHGRYGRAVDVLRRGAEYFSDSARRSVPRPDMSVNRKYDRKASEIHAEQRLAAKVLQYEIERIRAEATRRSP